jgi:ubiquinone/menaquinone biosynthesis C-methylase UbiE
MNLNQDITLKGLQKKWDTFGKTNAMWAVLTASREWSQEEFFATGIEEINSLMGYMDSLDINVSKKKALDFGCGLGRLTQALADHFDEVHGVDISPSMIEGAKKYNRHGTQCQYHLNTTGALEGFSDNTFDLIYSNIVLQHIQPRHTKRYVIEFLRILSPQGLLVFQLPDDQIDRKAYKRLIKNFIPKFVFEMKRRLRYRLRSFLDGQPQMEMYGIKLADVIALIEEHGGKILDVELDQSETAPRGWTSLRYSVTKM